MHMLSLPLVYAQIADGTPKAIPRNVGESFQDKHERDPIVRMFSISIAITTMNRKALDIQGIQFQRVDEWIICTRHKPRHNSPVFPKDEQTPQPRTSNIAGRTSQARTAIPAYTTTFVRTESTDRSQQLAGQTYSRHEKLTFCIVMLDILGFLSLCKLWHGSATHVIFLSKDFLLDKPPATHLHLVGAKYMLRGPAHATPYTPNFNTDLGAAGQINNARYWVDPIPAKLAWYTFVICRWSVEPTVREFEYSCKTTECWWKDEMQCRFRQKAPDEDYKDSCDVVQYVVGWEQPTYP